MFSIPGLLLVVLTIYLRPQEIWPRLQSVPLLHMFLALALLGLAVDLKLRLSRPSTVPQLGWGIAFVIVQAVSLLTMGAGGGGIGGIIELAIPFVLFVIVSHGVQTFRALEVVTSVLLVMVIFLAFVGIHQHFAATGCHVRAAGEAGVASAVWDGRYCVGSLDCILNDPEPGAQYVCEHVGLMGTSSVGGRVRWRGVLADPNELSLAVSIGLPFAFALLERRRNAARWWLAAIAAGMVGACVVFTQSRGGQLVLGVVLGTYFVRRFGWKGILLAGLAVLPVLMLGGRSGEEAAKSSLERYDAWHNGLLMFRGSPVVGVGKGNFGEFHHLNAHNSYVLVAAELGLIGMWIWSTVLYLSAKIPYQALRQSVRYAAHEGGQVARVWGTALLATTLGLLVGIFFLSMTHHYVLWIYAGLCGALYTCIKAHDPEFKVTISFRELIGLVVLDLFVLGFVLMSTHGKV